MSRLLRYALLVSTLVVAGVGCASKQVRVADQFGREGNWDAAVLIYLEASAKRPDDRGLRAKLDRAKVAAAKVHHQRGKDLLAQRAVGIAVEEFKQAVSLDPSQDAYRVSLTGGLKSKEAEERYTAGLQLLKAEKYVEGIEELERALVLDPTFSQAGTAIDEAVARRRVLESSQELNLTSTQPITLRFQNAKLKDVFDLLSKASGVNFIFDRDIRDENITIFVKNASFYDALNLVLTTNNLFMKRAGEDTLLILPKTKQKIDQYQDLLIRTFYLSSSKAKDMVNLLRTMLETRRVFSNEELNTIVIRDTPEKIRLAEKIIEANDRQVAEVMFEVEVLEITRNDSLKYGWNFFRGQQQGGQIQGDLTPNPLALDRLKDLSSADVLITLPSVLINLIKLDSNAKTLANPKVRVVDNKEAEINIGDKVPIQLSTTTSTTAVAGGTTAGSTTALSTEFKDVGIKLNIKPSIRLNNDVTMEVKLDVTSLGEFDTRVQQFRFGTRNTKTTINVRDGETVILGGLIRDEDRQNFNKIPGLGDLPVLGKLFSSTEKAKVKSDVVLTITPRVIRGLAAPEGGVQSFWSGTEETYSTKPIFSTTDTVSQPAGVSEPEPATRFPAAPPPPAPVVPSPPLPPPRDGRPPIPGFPAVPPPPIVPAPSTVQ